MKTFPALAWRRSADEKIPLSSKNGVPDNGAISKSDISKEVAENMASGKSEDFSTCSTEKHASGKVDDVDSLESKPMSLLRKFAMFLSLDIIALYIVALAWLIPCRHLQCNLRKEWSVDLYNVSISTNLEIGGPLRSEVLMFAHFEENIESESVTALLCSTGSVKWQISLDFRPVHCHCKVVDVNGDDVLDCLIFGNDRLLAINASDGHVFWDRDFWKISLLTVAVSDCENEGSKWLAVVESKGSLTEYTKDRNPRERISMVILNSRSGSVVRDFPLNCDFFPKQLVTWRSETNVSRLAFHCSYNGKTEVKLISEDELCSFGRSVPKMAKFPVLFSFGSSTAVDDVFLLPVSHVGLVVGWSTMVAMATDARNPPRLLWQTMSSIRSAIKSLSGGYFISRNSTQVAAVLYDGSSSVVKVVNVSDGREVASVDLGSGTVTSVLPVSGKMEDSDSLLIVKDGSSGAAESPTASEVIDFTTESTHTANLLRQTKRYLLLTFGKENNVTELLTENRRTEVTVLASNCATLFIATLMSNQTTRISSHFLNISKNSCSCS